MDSRTRFQSSSDLNIRSQPVSGLHAVTFKCDSATILPRSKIEQYTYASKPHGQQQAVDLHYRPLHWCWRARVPVKLVLSANKIAHLIRGCGYQARHIAAVTFTNKAAREMKERVGQTLGRKEARGLMISTFHTLGLDIIKREYAALGMKANFSLFDDTDQLALLKKS